MNGSTLKFWDLGVRSQADRRWLRGTGSWGKVVFKGSAGCPEILETGDCGVEGLGRRHWKSVGGQVGGGGRGQIKVIVRGEREGIGRL